MPDVLRACERTELKRPLAMWWEFTWIGGRKVLNSPFFSQQGLVAGLQRAPHMGCMMPSVEGLRENRTEEGTPHSMWWGWGQEREEIAAGKRWRQKVLRSLGVPFFIRSKV